jgi:hypothetical protein
MSANENLPGTPADLVAAKSHGWFLLPKAEDHLYFRWLA